MEQKKENKENKTEYAYEYDYAAIYKDLPYVLTLKECAIILKVSEKTVKRMIIAGDLQRLPMHQIRVTSESLIRYLCGGI